MRDAQRAVLSDSHEFEDLDWEAPLDVGAYAARAKSGAHVKGMFFTCVTQLAREVSGRSFGLQRYAGFKNYPLADWLDVLPACACAAYPTLSLRRALFETGTHIYSTFATSTIGSVVMSVAGRDFRGALRLVTRAYEAVGSSSNVTLIVDEPHRAVVAVRDMAEFPDCYQAGILSAGASHYGVQVRVRVRSLGLLDCDVELTWD